MIDVLKSTIKLLVVDVLIKGTLGGAADGIWCFIKEHQKEVEDILKSVKDGG